MWTVKYIRGCFHFCCALHVESACQFELEQPEYRSNAFCEGQVLELISTCSARQKWKQPRTPLQQPAIKWLLRIQTSRFVPEPKFCSQGERGLFISFYRYGAWNTDLRPMPVDKNGHNSRFGLNFGLESGWRDRLENNSLQIPFCTEHQPVEWCVVWLGQSKTCRCAFVSALASGLKEKKLQKPAQFCAWFVCLFLGDWNHTVTNTMLLVLERGNRVTEQIIRTMTCLSSCRVVGRLFSERNTSLQASARTCVTKFVLGRGQVLWTKCCWACPQLLRDFRIWRNRQFERSVPLYSLIILDLWLYRFLSSRCCTSFKLRTISNTVPSMRALASPHSKSYGILCWNFLQSQIEQQAYARQRIIYKWIFILPTAQYALKTNKMVSTQRRKIEIVRGDSKLWANSLCSRTRMYILL